MKRILLPGLLAGFVVNIPDGIVSGAILQKPLADEVARHGGVQTPIVIPWYIGCDFVVGFLLVWLYSVARPRLGAGPMTAVKVALALWVVPWMYGFGKVLSQERDAGMYLTMAAGALAGYVLGALAGGWLYKEE